MNQGANYSLIDFVTEHPDDVPDRWSMRNNEILESPVGDYGQIWVVDHGLDFPDRFTIEWVQDDEGLYKERLMEATITGDASVNMILAAAQAATVGWVVPKDGSRSI